MTMNDQMRRIAKFAGGGGMALGIIAILVAQFLDGGSIRSLFDPSALVLVLFGTMGATLAARPFEDLFRTPGWFRMIFASANQRDPIVERDVLLEFARRARREGLLRLDSLAAELTDGYLQRGIQMVVDGIDHETIDTLLYAERKAHFQNDSRGATFFETAGGFSPTLGIIGTVVGLISVLSNITDVARLAPSIATAFTATLWGVLLANILWLPGGSRLRTMAEETRFVRELQAVGVVSIALGHTPAQTERQLEAMLAGHHVASGAAQANPPGEGAQAPAADFDSPEGAAR